ncbi:MAG: ribonuclease [Proteobacteria bacterium]|nr:ribonuclease [Pseudomonadota bacterium]
MSQRPPPLYIDTSTRLEQFCRDLTGTRWLAMDTEFLREKTYYPKFCLLQIAAENGVACIDPLALQNLDPLAEILYSPDVTKVLHSARQDLEIFYHLYGKLPGPVFDTQLAAPLLGMADQISYAGLVGEMLGVHLSKAQSRTDWSRRPLTQEQLRYAADDVIYLAEAYRQMLARLHKLQRFQWLEQEFADLTDPVLYESPPESAWQRISGAYQLKGKQLSVLQVLAAWREQTARAQDIPRGWLIKDEALFDMARQHPLDTEAIKSIRGLDERTARRHGPELCQMIGTALQQPPPPVEHKPRPAKKSQEQEALLDVMMAVVRLRAAQHTLNPSVLASRKDLEQLLDGHSDARLTKGWRWTMAGEELAAVLRGELGIKVSDGSLSLFAHA